MKRNGRCPTITTVLVKNLAERERERESLLMYIDLIQARAQYAHIRLRELRFMTYFYSSNLVRLRFIVVDLINSTGTLNSFSLVMCATQKFNCDRLTKNTHEMKQ